jgi:hypothetical protein
MSLELTTKSGTKLDTRDATLRMVINSPMFADALPGSFSYPFTLPTTPINQEEFGYLENSNAKKFRKTSHETTIKADGMSILKGRLNVREGFPRFYDCDITVPYANISAEFWDSRMNTHDWGSEQLPTVTKSPNIFAGEIPENEVNFYGLKTTSSRLNFYEVVVDSQTIFSHENAAGINPDDNLQTRLNEMTGVFNAQFSPRYSLAVVGNVVQLQSQEPVFLAFIRANIYDLTQQTFTTNLPKIPEYTEADIAHFSALAEINFAGKPWRLATMNVAGNGIANLFFDGGIDLNLLAADRQIITPVPTLKMILEGIADAIGYTVSGDFHADTDLQQLCFYSGYVLDKQLEGIAMPFYILESDFQYAKMMPSFTFRKFLNELRTTFNLAIRFDPFTRVMSIRKADIVAISVPTEDFTDKANPNYRTLDSENAKNNLQFRWKIDGSDPAAKTKTDEPIEFFNSFPVSEDNEGFTGIESELQPILQQQKTYVRGLELDMFVGGLLAFYTPIISGNTFEQITYQSLICEKPLYNDITDIDTAPRIFFYTQKLEGSSERGAYALHWDKLIADTGTLRLATGIYSSFWKSSKELLNDIFEIETDIAFTPADLSNIDLTKPILLFGGRYLIKQIDAEFPVRKPSKTRLWRC